MKTVSIREAQHNLGKILQDVAAGETVQITRRRTPLARLIPEPSLVSSNRKVDWGDHTSRLIKPRKANPEVSSDSVLADLRGER